MSFGALPGDAPAGCAVSAAYMSARGRWRPIRLLAPDRSTRTLNERDPGDRFPGTGTNFKADEPERRIRRHAIGRPANGVAAGDRPVGAFLSTQ
jgi:hypothetical protein